jgi:hypothetical protein
MRTYVFYLYCLLEDAINMFPKCIFVQSKTCLVK